MGERFLDNQRIEGNIAEMLDGAIQFVNRNMRVKTIVDPETGKRKDRTDYPITAIRKLSLMHWCIAIIVFIQKVCLYSLLCLKTGWRLEIWVEYMEE